ncbi:transposase IS4 family [Ferroplasma acidiphilum]|jgi:transposase|uniref:Transposase IS4-like domain-containing protein n=2 Tax=Ferroplasma TaxID=74968 RepID=S0APQ8_FERAC|nr:MULTISPECIES: IS1634 family transposase [Ferroplasma]AGO60045.1 hypothetical protein FACI_IFERC00001G0065 [Ferroplasma acidarmanus Fer1]AGO61113.1 hypothetical protein FACI_IFERC00001G1133 [Ferroplasma acidarmanus Fer1]AGO61548.1 hypothetical protein FACI_IFERC00001G1568 [Ferroplasma acidarmanus Fer1]ARD85290.1 transposase IS4 family [Ferroplasma acidiphilum]WMT53565.1 MAG: IS1634 family transposase [Ferroplasma acidiphilum]
MNNMPDWVLEHKGKGIEIRRFGDRYYAYESSSRYDKDLKRARKVTGKYLGVVTPAGIIKKSDVSGIRGDYEYGNIALLYGIAGKTVLPVLKQVFPYMYDRIIIYVILRDIQPLPMKSLRYLYEKTYLSRMYRESMSPGSISGMLSSLPQEGMVNAMGKLTEKGEYVLMDSTAIFSRSDNISFLEPGHNSKEIHLPQINVMMLFSSTRTLPTFIRVLPGSIRDVSAMANTIDMAGIEKCVIVADKGFFSADNIKKLKKRHLSYIIPLRRNSSLVPDTDDFLGVFMYNGKPVKYWKPENGVYMFEDPVLKSEEERDYLIRIHDNIRPKSSYYDHSGDFGKLYLLSDINDEPERIYRLYKDREYVEYAFNVYKNDLEADRSYIRDDHMLSAYMFLNLLSLYLHFQVLNMIDGKYSVKDVLLILSRIKIYNTGKTEMVSEIPKKAKELISKLGIDLDILRKK